jgi:heterodisulfide reductase subunit A
MPIPQAVPHVAVIDQDYCVGCGLCAQACPADAVEFGQQPEETEIRAGAVIVATGYELFDPRRKEEYGYGVYPDVITNMELERLLNAAGPTRGTVVRPSSGDVPFKVAFIQCVGSRDESVGNPYCSRVCCMSAMKNAQLLKERYPDIEIVIHYIDIRASGEMYEEYYARTQAMGITFVRGKVAEIIGETDALLLRFEDTLECAIREDRYDLVVLSTGMEAPKAVSKLVRMLKISCRPDRFIAAAHPKMRPVDSHINGIFVAGCASGPGEIQLSIAQGAAAASRAARLLGQEKLTTDPLRAVVDPEKCIGCGVCTEVCDYGNITIIEGKAVVDEISCSGCGTCSASCPADAIDMHQFTDRQIYAQIEAALEVKDEFPLIITFLCNWCSYAAADLAGTSRIRYPSNVRIIRVMCAGRVDPDFILSALEKGADGVLVAGCRLGECHYVNGNYHAAARMENLAGMLKDAGFSPERLKVAWIAASEGEKFARTVETFVDELELLGPVGSELPEAEP